MSSTKHELGRVKPSVDSFAILGGKPAFSTPLHVGGPNIGDRANFLNRVNDILDRRYLTNGGQYVNQLERRIEQLLGVKHCVATCNATIALEVLIRTLGLTGEVIVPSFTFIATAHALQLQQVKPVFADIDPRTHTLDPSKIQELITPRTTGILAVNLWGAVCDVAGLTQIANQHGLKLLFDSAHGFGSSYQGKPIGHFGNAEVFSFHATKFLNSIEGGAIVTNDSSLAESLQLTRNFGFTTYDQTDLIGTNAKMNEVSAAMGLTNLESMDEFVAVNQRHYEQYCRELESVEGVSIFEYDETEKTNYQYVVLEIDARKTMIGRDQLVDLLHRENVLARRYFYPGCHRMEPYRSLYPEADQNLPVTNEVASRVMCLPTGTTISSADVTVICDLLRIAIQNGAELAGRLQAHRM